MSDRYFERRSLVRNGRRMLGAAGFSLLAAIYIAQAGDVASAPLDQVPTRVPTDTPRPTHTPTATRTPDVLATKVVDVERNYTGAMATVKVLEAEVTKQAVILDRATGERAQIEGRLNALEGFDRGVIFISGGLALFNIVRFLHRRYGGHHGGGH